jgi:AbrB family looped-hinge helix DNA binding protein
VALVRVKEKFQITLPGEVRKQAKLAVGDYLEAKVDGHAIQLTRRSVMGLSRNPASRKSDIMDTCSS